jgi:hypothetical protein
VTISTDGSSPGWGVDGQFRGWTADHCAAKRASRGVPEESRPGKDLGFSPCSQSRMLEFIEDLVYPVRRTTEQQEQLVTALNPILRRDGYLLVAQGSVSGYPLYKVRSAVSTGAQPADDLISGALSSFADSGVNAG